MFGAGGKSTIDIYGSINASYIGSIVPFYFTENEYSKDEEKLIYELIRFFSVPPGQDLTRQVSSPLSLSLSLFILFSSRIFWLHLLGDMIEIESKPWSVVDQSCELRHIIKWFNLIKSCWSFEIGMNLITWLLDFQFFSCKLNHLS